MKKTYYKWFAKNGKIHWFNVSIHKYLMSGELQRAYMRQSHYSGISKRLTKEEHIAISNP